MRAKIDPIRQARIARLKFRQRLVPAARKSPLFPDLIEAARVAAVAQQRVLAAYPEPASDPNVDGILLRERPPRGGHRAAIERIAHLTVEQHPALIADESSKLMAAPGRSRETST